jgi:F-type H+-transporting ATPase subunit b
MLSLVFAAAAFAAETPADGPAGLLQKFGVEWKFVIWQFVSFAILAGVLYQFAIKPIIVTVDQRNAKIGEGLKNAAATAATLAQAQVDAAATAKQAQLEAARFVEEARQAAKEFLDAQQKEATARANDLVVKAQQAIELEHKRMLEEARTEVARLVVATTQRVLARELGDAERTRYNEAAARELTEIKS